MKSACFTGHRNIQGNPAELEKRLYTELEKAIKEWGITEYYNGAALGWDLFSARVVLKLKKVYPQVKLHLILPCSPEEQTADWSDEQCSEYMSILSAADSVEQTSEHYYNGCMKVRNARLVELADCCYCYLNPNRKRSGTGQTVRMAQKKNIMVVNFYDLDQVKKVYDEALL